MLGPFRANYGSRILSTYSMCQTVHLSKYVDTGTQKGILSSVWCLVNKEHRLYHKQRRLFNRSWTLSHHSLLTESWIGVVEGRVLVGLELLSLIEHKGFCVLIVPSSHLMWRLCLPITNSELSTLLLSLWRIQFLPEPALWRKNIASYI